MIDKHTKKNIESSIYACAKNMLLDDLMLIDVGNINHNGKSYHAYLEVKENASNKTIHEMR